MLRQLLGLRLTAEAGGHNIYDAAWLRENPRPDLRVGQRRRRSSNNVAIASL